MRLRALLLSFLLTSTAASAQAPATHESALDRDVLTLHYDDLVRDLAATPPGPEHDFFSGILADRSGRYQQAIDTLQPFAAQKDLPPHRMALALSTLADAEFKLFHYAEASRFYDALFAGYSAQLAPDVLKDDQDDNATLKLLLNTPPQTIALNSQVDLPTSTDPLGDITTSLTVHGVTTPWILDTGANLSVISESFAHKLGLTLSAGTAQTMGSTGAENSLHIAVLDELHLGPATLHNVVFLVLPDANLMMPVGPKDSFALPGILGYPVFQALGSIRFTHDHRFLAGPGLQTGATSAPLYMEKLNVLVTCTINGLQREFQFDSGAQHTSFYITYYRDFPSDFAQQKLGHSQQYGAGGTSTTNVYILKDVPLHFAGQTVTLHDVAVQAAALHVLADEYEGTLGRDFFANSQDITLDFTHARAALGPPALAH
jgi:predicted aspartyl protease